MTDQRTMVFYDVTFECKTCGITEEARMINSLFEIQAKVQGHEELGHEGSISYAPWYLEEDIYTGKHSLTGGL